jgi:conjugal transfer pilus assembly protein TraI
MRSPKHEPVEPKRLVEQAQRRIDLIAQCANEAKAAEFDRKWLAVIRRCAEWFSSVPLSPELYREPGGAFRFTIETAFFAMRLAGGLKFGANLPSEKRRLIEPQYNYGVFLAAMCSGLDEPYRHFAIVRDSDLTAWNPSAHGAATAWLENKPYTVSRRPTALPIERMRTGMLAQMVVGPELLSGLDAQVMSEMFGAINPSQQPLGGESLTHKVARQAIAVAMDFDRKAQHQVFEPVTFAVPSAIHVAAALQPVANPTSGAAFAAPAAATAGTPTPPAAPPATPPATPEAMTEASGAGEASEPARQNVQAPAAPSSLLEALGLTAKAPEHAAAAAGAKAQQLGLPFSEATVAPVDPAAMRTAAPVTPSATARPTDIDDVLKDAPNMIRELFRALREDVASGKASVEWDDKGLVLSKRLIGAYGVASETLVEHLRKRSLLVGNQRAEITLSPRAGELILPR